MAIHHSTELKKKLSKTIRQLKFSRKPTLSFQQHREKLDVVETPIYR